MSRYHCGAVSSGVCRYMKTLVLLVLTTTNKARLDETVGVDSEALEIVGKPYDLEQIKGAIDAALGQQALGRN